MHCGGAVVSPDTHAHTVHGVLLRGKGLVIVCTHNITQSIRTGDLTQASNTISGQEPTESDNEVPLALSLITWFTLQCM